MGVDIKWKDDYLLGVDAIDNQHKYLFRHFTAEEQLMKKANYPYYNRHKQIHDQLISSLNQKTEHVFGDPEKLRELNLFLGQWLIQHIMSEDFTIKSSLQKQGLDC